MKTGIYEQIINKIISQRLAELPQEKYYINKKELDKLEASRVISLYLHKTIKTALDLFPDDEKVVKQVELANKIIYLLRDELKDNEFEEDLLTTNKNLLTAVFSKIDNPITDISAYAKKITPETGLTYCDLFTGSRTGVSLESELRKEILSSDRIDFLVSFIKWSGIRIFINELQDFTARGRKLRIITTSYMGATDLKAIEFLSGLQNCEIKVSYNTKHERLHAKAYLFYRDSEFHTGYIGSSNLSRSALTDGLEWNIKLTTKEVRQIIEKIQKTFETYWSNPEFEHFDFNKDSTKLRKALKDERGNGNDTTSYFFDISPYPFQKEILEKLKVEREVHSRFKNLIVAATGTGKTIISAFDFKEFLSKNPNSNFLFVVHRKEILQQALFTYRGILRKNNWGELWVDGIEPSKYNAVFASVQTLNNRLTELKLTSTFYDYIVIDEVHHIAAQSYRPILEKFNPKILLGLTATPERMDGENILPDFGGHISAEIRLPDAMNRGLLCPFQYFGITDNVDLSKARWERGKYNPSELTRIYTQADFRVRDIIDGITRYVKGLDEVIALGFCVTKEHAEFMAEKFVMAGLKADYLTSDSNTDIRETAKNKLINKEINYLFVVDLYNEGVDIPEINTVLFLRPTESLTIFLQQLGRGLRHSEGKECLTVLDFVANSRQEYDFENKFRALVGKTARNIEKEIQENFPHLPLGCSIVLEKIAKERILQNIAGAISNRRNTIITKIQNFSHQSTLPLTLENFLDFNHLELNNIYRHGTWNSLLYEAGVIDQFDDRFVGAIKRTVEKKWLTTRSISYFNFLGQLIQSHFDVDFNGSSEKEKLMLNMLYYDIWQEPLMHESLNNSLKIIGTNTQLCDELLELLDIMKDRIDFMESDIDLPYEQPLKVHARYTRDQILAAFRFHTYSKKSSNREGVAEIKELNSELLFIDLNKSEEDYSPSTLYQDYAINETIFHWQSQNAARPDKGKGLSYIQQSETGKIILLFVREEKKDENKNTLGYVFLGRANFISSDGQKPMSINWQLEEPIPPYLWEASAKLSIG